MMLHIMKMIFKNLVPTQIHIPGSHWRVLRQLGSGASTVSVRPRWFFAFLTGHLSLPPVDAITTISESVYD
jgi:hypothetical protein